MRPDTDCAHLLRAYVRAWPAWLGGEGDAKRNGFKYHTQSQRSGELTRRHGFPCESRARETATRSWGYHEYRFRDAATHERAWLQVKAWQAGVPVEELTVGDVLGDLKDAIREATQTGLFTGGGA